MKKYLFTLLSVFSILQLFAQSSFKAKFTTENQFACYEIVKTGNGHYLGFSSYPEALRSYYYLFDKKLVLEDNYEFRRSARFLGFYTSSEQTILAVNYFYKNLNKVTYNYDNQKVELTEPKTQNLNGFYLRGKYIYTLSGSITEGMTAKKAYFSGSKYNILSETSEKEFENKDEMHKAKEDISEKLIFLKNGNILLFVQESKSKPNPISIRPDGFSIYLYDNDLNLLSSESFKGEYWYDLNNGLSLLCNPSMEDIVCFWTRKVDTNKMTLFQISVEEKKIKIKGNKIVHKEVETTILNKNIDENGYNEIFKLLITQMPVDKYQENPGTGYKLDSVYVLGENTYINYHVVQGIKVELDGLIYMCGIFILDKEGKLIKNYTLDAAITNAKKRKDKNQLDDGVKQLYSFYSNSKILYAYTRNTKLMGFEIEDGKEMTEMDPVNIKIPSTSKDKQPWETFSIIPLGRTSFILKALNQKLDKGEKKCDYTLFNIE